MNLEDAEKIFNTVRRHGDDCAISESLMLEAYDTIVDAYYSRIAELEKQNDKLLAENERMRTKLGSASMTMDENENMKNAFVEFAEIVKMRCDTPLEVARLATRLLIAYQNDEPYED